MKVSVELGDDILRVVDEQASRSGRPRDEIIAEAVRLQAASAMLADLLVGRDDGLSDDDADAVAHSERNAFRAERRRRDRQQDRAVAP
ncbi:MAG: ribbon-helix-helix protein, CopG family [Pseudonocardiaceae bacterium]